MRSCLSKLASAFDFGSFAPIEDEQQEDRKPQQPEDSKEKHAKLRVFAAVLGRRVLIVLIPQADIYSKSEGAFSGRVAFESVDDRELAQGPRLARRTDDLREYSVGENEAC